ncbi:hypothetical protein HG531_012772 [Fusarium graminearum]|nr:hypothetical protein HG531_012772 [Fusarium graminearum]
MVPTLQRLQKEVKLALVELLLYLFVTGGGQQQSVHIFEGNWELSIIPTIVDNTKDLVRNTEVDEDEEQARRIIPDTFPGDLGAQPHQEEADWRHMTE